MIKTAFDLISPSDFIKGKRFLKKSTSKLKKITFKDNNSNNMSIKGFDYVYLFVIRGLDSAGNTS